MVEERAYWLAWSQITGVGPVLLKRIEQHFETLAEAWVASPKELGAVEGVGDRLINVILQERQQLEPAQLLHKHRNFWTPADPEYPRLLLEIPSSPPVLYYQGQIQPEENQGTTPLVGIVGTRYPTEHGRRWTRKISTALAQHGITVVSGMAAGIDAQAHCGCLEAGGRTIAVLGTGVDVVYPHQHRQLHQQIQQQGLVVSEYPAGTRPDKGNFPARNRIIAGLSRAVLVLEAPQKSGALITARYANDFGRDVYTLPNSPDVREARGCLGLLHQGAEVIVEVEELLEKLGAIPELAPIDRQPVQAPLPDLEPELAQVLGAIAPEPTSYDMIVQQSGLATASVASALLQLELFGLVTQLPGMRYQRS